jgi:hypothetical protein
MKPRYSLFLPLLLPFVEVVAQPTFTAGSLSPVPGDDIFYSTGDFREPGPGGANAIWDHSGFIATNNTTAAYLTPAATGSGATFPNSTVALNGGGNNYTFYHTSATGVEDDGFIESMVTATCSDRLTLLTYPLAYNGSISDNATCSLTDGNTTWTRTSTITGTVDGWGTLIMYWGSVDNVLRVHTSQQTTDSQFGAVSTKETYAWYAAGVHIPLMTSERTSESVFGFTFSDSTSTQVAAGSIGLDEAQHPGFGFRLSPNPGTDHVSVMLWGDAHGVVTIELTDMLGNTISSAPWISQTSDRLHRSLDISGLASGVYVVRVMNARGTILTERLVKP